MEFFFYYAVLQVPFNISESLIETHLLNEMTVMFCDTLLMEIGNGTGGKKSRITPRAHCQPLEFAFNNGH